MFQIFLLWYCMPLSFLTGEIQTTLFGQDERIVLLTMVYETWEQPSYRNTKCMRLSAWWVGREALYSLINEETAWRFGTCSHSTAFCTVCLHPSAWLPIKLPLLQAHSETVCSESHCVYQGLYIQCSLLTCISYLFSTTCVPVGGCGSFGNNI